MTRLPFDPDKLRKPDTGTTARRERARTGDGEDALSVTQLSLMIKDALTHHVKSPLRVVGELSNFRDRRHWYLSLKDEANVIDCVMFASAAAKVRFQPEQGQQVVATGRLDFYGPQGKTQLYLDKLEPVGIGALELRFRQLCEELRAAGYFDDAHKQPLPVFPQRLAVVTSESAAALQDVIRTAQQRWPGIELRLVDVRVQGDEAAAQIARAIERLSRHHGRLGIDAVILTRGGGSLEDLWAFNERIVADAIYACDLPVVAAIGHETDTTIAELVADLRCSTPTQAAAMLVPDRAAELQHVDQLEQRLRTGLLRYGQHQRARLDAIIRHEWFRKPAEYIGRLKREMDERHRRLATAQQQGLTTRSKEIEAMEKQLQAVSPLNVLTRGYSYTTDEQGRILRSTKDATGGQLIRTHLSDGTIDSRVEGRPAKPTSRRKSAKPTDTDPGLFGEG